MQPENPPREAQQQLCSQRKQPGSTSHFVKCNKRSSVQCSIQSNRLLVRRVLSTIYKSAEKLPLCTSSKLETCRRLETRGLIIARAKLEWRAAAVAVSFSESRGCSCPLSQAPEPRNHLLVRPSPAPQPELCLCSTIARSIWYRIHNTIFAFTVDCIVFYTDEEG